MGKSKYALFVVLLLVTSSFSFALATGYLGVVNAQTSTSCPSNLHIHITLPGGVPDSLTFTAGTDSAYILSYAMYYSAYPNLGPTGVPYWNMSLVDWLKSNSNYTQWTFNVRPGLRWSDGTNVNASDILATYSPRFAFNASYDFTGAHSEVTKEYALNSSAAVFNLNVADAHFPETISTLALANVVPASDVAKYGPNWNAFGTPAVVGPFYPVNYVSGATTMTMARNPYFYTTGLPEPKACELDANFIESAASGTSLLISNATDIAQLDPAAAPTVLKYPYLHILDQKASDITTMTYNQTGYPLNMTAFRQALVYAINESQIVKQAWFGFAQTAYNAQGIVPSSVTQWYTANQQQYPYNPQQALKLMNSIGMTKGSDGMLHYRNGTVVTLNLIGENTKFAADAVTAGLVQNYLQALGIKLNSQIVSYKDITSRSSVPLNTLFLTTGSAPVFADAAINALPGWDVYSHPAVPETHWIYPPSADAQYQSNLTAVDSTANPTLLAKYLGNIERLNAEYIPTVVLDYPDALFAYSTSHWTGWLNFPAGWYHMNGNVDTEQYASLTPAAPTTTTTTPPSTTTTTPPIVTTPSTTTTSAPPPSGMGTYTLLGVAVVVIVIIAVVALALSRRGKGRAPSPPATT